MTLHINDGGVWRAIREVYVNDNGTWRSVLEVYVNDSGNWRTVFQRYDEITLTAGTDSLTVGFISGSFGSVSPSTLGDGRAINRIANDASEPRFQLHISGFSSDPGADYLEKIEINGLTLQASAASYAFGGGIAGWDWIGTSASLANGGSYPTKVYRA